MSDENEVVGHKTFATCDPLHPFRHEPLTRKEADAVLARIASDAAERAEKMPTEQDAARTLWEAWYRLKELGWKEARYAGEFRKEGLECRLIELGSSGIHVGYYHETNGNDVWWVGAEGYPSHPCLVSAVGATSTGSEK